MKYKNKYEHLNQKLDILEKRYKNLNQRITKVVDIYNKAIESDEEIDLVKLTNRVSKIIYNIKRKINNY